MVNQELAYQAVQPALNKGRAVIALPSDAGDAAAYVLNFIQTGNSHFDRSLAIKAMQQRVEQLREKTGDHQEAELMAHAITINALFQLFTAESVRAGAPEHKAIFAKLALNCNAAYTRTLIASEGLRQQRQGKAVIR